LFRTDGVVVGHWGLRDDARVTVHAFVDESQRSRRYLVAAAIVRPARLDPVRRTMRSLLLPGQRELHFHNEKEARQRTLADAIARLPVEVSIYTKSSVTRNDEPAREACVRRLAEDLADRQAHRLVIDSRQERDKLDKRAIRAVLLQHPHGADLVYEHVESAQECLLWIADAVGWCYGAGAHWRRRVDPVITNVANLD
jgi:hypothetical protein